MDDKQYHVLRAAEARARKNAKLNELKSAPCTDCGVKFHYSAMDFDHIADDKVRDVAWLMKNRAWSTVLEEIVKCELVCSNCHRYRTWKRMHKIK